MMSWGTIRKATEQDIEILNAKAQEFAERHNLGKTWVEWESPLSQLESELAVDEGHQREHFRYLRKLWKRILRRTLDEQNADGIAYGYVGYHVD